METFLTVYVNMVEVGGLLLLTYIMFNMRKTINNLLNEQCIINRKLKEISRKVGK